MSGRRDRTFGTIHGYIASVGLCAIALTAISLRRLNGELTLARHHWLELVLFTILLCVCELRPITVARGGGVDEIVSSTTFAFAIFLVYGPVAAMGAQALASIVSDLVERKTVLKMTFNVSQYLTSWGAAGVVFTAVIGSDHRLAHDIALTPRWALATALAAGTYFVINNALVGSVVAISAGTRVNDFVLSSLRQEWSSNLVLLALAPVVAVVADRSLWVLPLLLLPVLDVYRSAAISAEQDHQARHDSLTGLPNRLSFLTVVERRIAKVDGKAAVLLIDLDHFKEVNDTLGHQAGDGLLREIGPRIQQELPPQASIARLGGDEFAVLLPTVESEAAALEVAERISAALDSPFTVQDFELLGGGSVGVAVYPSHGTTTELLLKHADIAMYVAKGGKGGIELYDPEQDHHSTRRLGLMTQLRTALAEGQVVLYYQPKLDLHTGLVLEAEALVRWIHPELGLIPPGEFVPMAEHTGLIRPLTSHVLQLAASQMRAWQQIGLDICVSVNLSARSLHDSSIADEIDACLAAHQLTPRSLRLEITESSIMEDPARAKRVLERLHETGLRLVIDDFGTGYSSLAYLQDLPVSEIKIDRSFVMNLLDNDADQVIVRSTIDLARNLGLTSTAEGVESEGTLGWLRDAGCDHAQGYHIARPMTAAAMLEWMRTREAPTPTSPDDLARVVHLFPPARPRRSGAS